MVNRRERSKSWRLLTYVWSSIFEYVRGRRENSFRSYVRGRPTDRCSSGRVLLGEYVKPGMRAEEAYDRTCVPGLYAARTCVPSHSGAHSYPPHTRTLYPNYTRNHRGEHKSKAPLTPSAWFPV